MFWRLQLARNAFLICLLSLPLAGVWERVDLIKHKCCWDLAVGVRTGMAMIDQFCAGMLLHRAFSPPLAASSGAFFSEPRIGPLWPVCVEMTKWRGKRVGMLLLPLTGVADSLCVVTSPDSYLQKGKRIIFSPLWEKKGGWGEIWHFPRVNTEPSVFLLGISMVLMHNFYYMPKRALFLEMSSEDNSLKCCA